MDKKQKEREVILYKSLKTHGYLLPTSGEDVDAFEEATKDIPVPDDLPNAMTILKRGYSTPHIAAKGDDVYSRNIAYAARNGKDEELPEDIIEQMNRDKEQTKKDI